jgi:dolichol kinase
VISIIALYFHRVSFDFKTFWLALVIAVAGTLGELFSWRGSDNLSIPMSIVLVLLLWL